MSWTGSCRFPDASPTSQMTDPHGQCSHSVRRDRETAAACIADCSESLLGMRARRLPAQPI